MPRRLAWMLAAWGFLIPSAAAAGEQERDSRPNILWITSEDNGPHLGAYGDSYAQTPQLDAFARSGLLYLNVWSNAPVCAPARTAIITGMHPASLGAEHMRSMAPLPPQIRLFPALLRAAGYYCTNNSKQDYNVEQDGAVEQNENAQQTGPAWDESSPRAHWKNRAAGQPFFAVFNHTATHESQIRAEGHLLQHDPAKARLPAYHPDCPQSRRDWAQYYDQMTEIDRLAGENLRELAEAGLEDDTIVFYFADHGPGLPRMKRWPYNAGLHVPLIVRIPEKFRHLRPADYSPGGRTDRLVSFVDLAPTVLALAQAPLPDYLQGRPFLGPSPAPAPEYLHGFRGRMDERIDLVRSVRDKRYVYLRQYMPHLIYGQHVSYMFQTPTTQAWKLAFDEGRTTPAQSQFWRTKPYEELYDLSSDPDEVQNLASSDQHRPVLERMRAAAREHALAIGDLGFLPEGEIHSRSQGRTPYELSQDKDRFPLPRILQAAEWASSNDSAAQASAWLSDSDSAVRYWGAMGLLIRPATGEQEHSRLRTLMADDSWHVRTVAAEILAQRGDEADRQQALATLLEGADANRQGIFTAIAALNAIDRLDELARPLLHDLHRLSQTAPVAPPRYSGYAPRLFEKIFADLAAP